MEIHSVFENLQPIPVKYTMEGENLSPPLTFKAIPEGAKCLVLIMDDPDAPRGVFDHWIIWNIPPTILHLSEGAPELFLKTESVQFGVNGIGEDNYHGPQPPAGPPHRYFFKLFALDKLLDLPSGSTKASVEKAIQDHILAEAVLIGRYQHDRGLFR